MRLRAAASARGDAARALEHYLSAGCVAGLPTEHHLRELVGLGDEAPGWMYSRWIVGQAYRWMMLRGDIQLTGSVLDTLDALYPEVAVDELSARELRELGTRVAAAD
jgi:hypothetical protein